MRIAAPTEFITRGLREPVATNREFDLIAQRLLSTGEGLKRLISQDIKNG